MAVTVRVLRKEALFRKLGALGPATAEAVEEANRQSATEMVSFARSFAPVRTGKLRDSIVATGPGASPPSHSQSDGIAVVPDGAYLVTAGNEDVRYAHLVEYGTAPHENAGMFAGSDNPGTRRQPFFWSAYRLIRKKMRSRVTRLINKAAKTVAGK